MGFFCFCFFRFYSIMDTNLIPKRFRIIARNIYQPGYISAIRVAAIHSTSTVKCSSLKLNPFHLYYKSRENSCVVYLPNCIYLIHTWAFSSRRVEQRMKIVLCCQNIAGCHSAMWHLLTYI